MIRWVCSDCGNKYGEYSVACSTYTEMYCEVCGKKKLCTEPRDFAFIHRFKGKPNKKSIEKNGG